MPRSRALECVVQYEHSIHVATLIGGHSPGSPRTIRVVYSARADSTSINRKELPPDAPYAAAKHARRCVRRALERQAHQSANSGRIAINPGYQQAAIGGVQIGDSTLIDTCIVPSHYDHRDDTRSPHAA